MEGISQPPALFVGRAAELERFATAAEHLRLVIVYGVGGVGKTSFMLRAAGELAGRLHGRVAHHACRAGESVASLARAVLVELGVQAKRGGEAVAALVQSARETPVIVCLDATILRCWKAWPVWRRAARRSCQAAARTMEDVRFCSGFSGTMRTSVVTCSRRASVTGFVADPPRTPIHLNALGQQSNPGCRPYPGHRASTEGK